MKKGLFLFTLLIFLFFGCQNQSILPENQSNPPSENNTDSGPATPFSQANNIANDDSPVPDSNQPAHPYEVTILMYHYIRDYKHSDDPIGTNLSVSPATFEQQMQWLKEHHYQSFSLSDFNLISRSDPALKPVIITFDDGYKDAYANAYPILKKYGFTGTFYIIAGSVGDSNYMTWEQIKELYNNGMTIGSHTISHPDLRNLSDTELISQLDGSRSLIKDNTSISVTDFCYPAGKYNENVITKLKELGYQTATTVAPGLATQDSSSFELPRYRITNDIEFGSFFNE